MEKLKDFIYEHSDLFFTAIIIAVVGVIVTSNLYGWFDIKDKQNKYKEINEIIHEEQEDIASESIEKAKSSDSDSKSKPEADKTPDKDTSDKNSDQKAKEPSNQNNASTETEAKKEPVKEPVIRNVDIASGSSSSSIAKALEKQGLVASSSEFLNTLVASGKETKLKAGTFAIPEGSSYEKIIEILTK